MENVSTLMSKLEKLTKYELIKLILSQEQVIERFEKDYNAMQLFYDSTNYRYKVLKGWKHGTESN